MARLTELREEGLTGSRGLSGLPDGGGAPAEQGGSKQNDKKSASHSRGQ